MVMMQPAVAACKEAVNRASETTLAEGLLFERRLFHSMFALVSSTGSSSSSSSSI